MLVLRLIRCLHNESICHCVTSKKDTFIFIILFFSNNFGLRAHTAEMKRGTIPDVSLIGLSTSCLSMFVGDGRGSVFNDIHVSAREEGKPKFVFFKKSLRSEQNKKQERQLTSGTPTPHISWTYRQQFPWCTFSRIQFDHKQEWFDYIRGKGYRSYR